MKAQKDGLIEIDLHVATNSNAEAENPCLLACMVNDGVPTFKRNEFSEAVEEWDKLRHEVLRVCVNQILIPLFKRESHERLLEEAREFVIKVGFL